MKNPFSPVAMMAAIAMFAGGLLMVGDNASARVVERTFTSFGFETPSAAGVIDEGSKTITITVPRGTDVTAMTPVFGTSTEDPVWAQGSMQWSGDASVDFTEPVTYTIDPCLLSRAGSSLTIATDCGGSVSYVVTVGFPTKRSAPKEALLPVEVSNIPMTMSGDQEGTATYELENGIKVKLGIMSGTVDNGATGGGVTYNVRYGKMDDAISNTYVEVFATDGNGNPVHQLLKKVTISISGLDFPADLSPLYVSGLNEAGNSWTEISGATFDAATGTATFQTDRLTRFAAFDRSRYVVKPPATGNDDVTPPPTEDPVVLGIVTFADGTLIRGSDMKIYVILNGRKVHIRSLAELAAKYLGQEIVNVADSVLAQY